VRAFTDLVGGALKHLAEEVEPAGPIQVPTQTARRVRLRRRRVVAEILVAAMLIGYGGFAGASALVESRRHVPTSRVTIPPAPAVVPCSPGALSRFLPPSPHDEDILLGVAVISENDVWAVGEQFNGRSASPGGQLALIEHWDGARWSIVPEPSSGSRNSVLNAVSGTASNDVWAVGRFVATDDPSAGSEAPLIEHWDGARWTIVPSARPAVHAPFSGIELTGVFARTPNDVWAVGFNDIGKFGGGETAEQTLVEHWDGHSWKVVPSPNRDDQSLLVSVSAVSSTDVWAVGASYVGFGEVSRSFTLVEHWDGSTWQIVSGPPTGSGTASNPSAGQPHPGVIETVAAISANNVWVAWDKFVYRWDGTGWTRLPSPGGVLVMAATNAKNIWAAGSGLAHWDGRKWTSLSIVPKLPVGSTLNAVGVDKSGDVWVVGGLGYAIGHQHPFSLRRCAGP
jgi:hypothetical protein